MDRLADEVLQVIFNEIDHPSSFALVCRRFNSFSKDPYVRAHYFISRYGSLHALYWALGRGALITEQVLDVLLSSGAHLSRYLVQIAVQHYFRSSCPFIKTPWVRTLSLSSIGHFMKLSSERFGTINIAKGEDDGTVFRNFIRESRRGSDRRNLATDAIVEMFEKGKFIPFYSKDPIITQFPLALSIEPRLLPLAIANGFRMDSRYRDFLFRRIFGRNQEHGVQDILQNVRELCRLDTSMFVSRAVAAEVLMEAETNRMGYGALKTLDCEGGLRFSLASLVEDLVKSFIRVHAVTTASTAASLRYLWKDYPSRNSIARLVMLLTVFIGCPKATPDTLHTNLERLNLTPVSSELIARALLSPFVDEYSPILRYARIHCGIGDDIFSSFLADVAVRCLEVSSKGKMLRSLCEDYPSLTDDIQILAPTKYRLTVGDLPSPEQKNPLSPFASKLCRDLYAFNLETAIATHEIEDGWDGTLSLYDETGMKQSEGSDPPIYERFLGDVGQETLTQVISRDESDPRRRRAPWLSSRISWPYKPPFPADVLLVGRWVRSHFGRRHHMTAIFMNHAVANDNCDILQVYLSGPVIVPITLHHFKMLARLGHTPNYRLFDAIKNGAVFFFSDNDYLKHPEIEVKRESETPCSETMPSGIVRASILSTEPSSSSAMWSAGPTRKRLHRSAAATVKSYAYAYAQSDSDDEAPTHETSESHRRTYTFESNLQLWIKHLSALHKDETKKLNEKKRHLEQSNSSSSKSRAVKNEFLKSLTISLRELRQLELAKKQQAHVTAVTNEGSGSDYDDYPCPKRPSKRRKSSA